MFCIDNSLQALGHETFCAVGSDIVVYDRVQIVRTHKVHDALIIGMIMIGKNLISYDIENNIKVWNTDRHFAYIRLCSL